MIAAAVAGLATPAGAETLFGALAKAYRSNPTLTAARENQQATDETVTIQRAQGLPGAAIQSNYNENVLIPPGQFVNILRTLGTSAQLQVPLYNGGGIRNGIRAARQRVEAGQEQLRGTELQVFSAVVAAYNDVIRDTAVVALNRRNVAQLETNLVAARDRFEIGDVTRTDVAQSEARLALARGDLRTAEANLVASKERYIQQVGEPPVALEPPPSLPALPADPNEAVNTALRENPDIAAARRIVTAAEFDVKGARATRLPTIAGVGQINRNDNFGSAVAQIPINIPTTQTSAAIGAQVRIPVFQGGLPAAQIRQAQARLGTALENAVATERNIVQQVRAAYASWKASQDVIAAAETAIAANTLSLEGVRAEQSVGNRTVIEVLNAEQELVNAQTALVTARRNAYVAAFTLLAAMGQAEARDLDLDVGTFYDPEVNARKVRRDHWDWSSRPNPTTTATRTAGTPAQDPSASGVRQ